MAKNTIILHLDWKVFLDVPAGEGEFPATEDDDPFDGVGEE